MTDKNPFRLDGKTALVTGSSRGLGRSMALALANVGADIILTGRTLETLERTAKEIEALGRKAIPMVIDMGTAQVCEAGFEACLEVAGPIHVLINNIGNRLIPRAIMRDSFGIPFSSRL